MRKTEASGGIYYYSDEYADIMDTINSIDMLCLYYMKRATINVDLKNWNSSLTDIDYTINHCKIIDPFLTFEELFFLKGTCYGGLGKFKIAEESYTKSLSFESNSPITYLNRAKVRFAQDNYKGTISDCNYFLTFPNNDTALLIEANLLKHDVLLKIKDYSTAIECLNKVIELDSTFLKPYLSRGIIYSNYLKDDKKALDSFNKLIALKPDYNYLVYSERAESYERLGQFENAFNDFQTALNKYCKKNPNDSHCGYYHFRIGRLHFYFQNYKNALLDFQNSRDIYSDPVHLYSELAKTHARLGNCDEAQTNLDIAIRKKIDDQELGLALKILNESCKKEF